LQFGDLILRNKLGSRGSRDTVSCGGGEPAGTAFFDGSKAPETNYFRERICALPRRA
jgi:hypothetical protein